MSYFKNGNLIEQATNVATAGGITTLTVSSKSIQNFTGSANQTVRLPVATTLAVGQKYEILNSSTGTLTIQYQDTSSFSTATVGPNTSLTVRLMDNSTANGVWGVAASSGKGTGGGKDYLTTYLNNPGNGDFELGSTTGWSLAHTTLASLIPNQASGSWTAANANLSISAVTSGKLAGSYSLQMVSTVASTPGDMLVSDAFTIDASDAAKVLTFKAFYSATSGASNLNFSGTSAASIQVYIYDVTNSAWIQPAGAYGMTQGFGVGVVTGTFQSSSNGTQYRIAFVNINASAGAFTMLMDDITISPQTTNIGPVVTDLTNTYTAVITGSTTPGTMTYSSNTLSWQQIGDQIRVTGNIRISSVTTSPTGNISINLPPNINWDPAKQSDSGRGNFGTTTSKINSINLATSFLTITAPSTNSVTVASGVSSLGPFVATDELKVDFMMPIQGWSSNVQMSNDIDTRVVALSVFKSTIQAIATSVDTTVTGYDTALVDTHSSFNATTGVYTIPVSGKYKVDMTTHFVSNATGYRVTQILKDGVVYQYGIIANAVSGDGTSTSASAIIDCTAGTQISQRVYQTSGGLLNIRALSNATSIHINRLSGPAVIAATESVNVVYETSAGQSIPTGSNTTVVFGTKVKDSHGTYNSSTGIWTCAVSGSYLLNANVGFVANATGIRRIQAVQAGSASVTRKGQLMTATSTDTNTVNIVAPFQCLAGDTINVQALQTSGGALNLSTQASENYINITRVGN